MSRPLGRSPRSASMPLSWATTGVVVRAVLVRPGLWASALGALRRMAAPRWWRHRPFLPLPDPAWWAFRMVTAYGRPDVEPEARDVVSYLEWCRATAVSAWAGPTGGEVPARHGPLAGRQPG